MTTERQALLHELLGTLLKEEELLARLSGLSQVQRQALINSQFAAIESINDEMIATANELLPLEQMRITVIEQLGVATLSEAAALADNLGVAGFAQAQKRLLAAATDFRSGQEQNASLVLHAIRLRDRWMNFLGGKTTPTYGAGGKREVTQQRQIVSRTA